LLGEATDDLKNFKYIKILKAKFQID